MSDSKPDDLPYNLLMSHTTKQITTKVPISPYPNIVASYLLESSQGESSEILRRVLL
jgi:hypothetical protein